MKLKSSSLPVKQLLVLTLVIMIASTGLRADTGNCGGATITLPFTDVSGSSPFFCSIASAYFAGLTNGTTATTFSPSANVPREQMAAFVTRTLDQSLKRGSRRAALGQFWTPASENDLDLTTVGTFPAQIKSDGADLWIANFGSNTVSRVRAGDGKLLGTWTGATGASGVLVAKGRIFVTANIAAGRIYQIDPTQPPGAVTTLTLVNGEYPVGIAFDGERIWTANNGSPGSVSIVTLSPLSVSTVSTGFSHPCGALSDGSNIWITDQGDNLLKKLDVNGNIIHTVNTGMSPRFPIFDGTNIWVPNFSSNSVTLVRAASGALLTTLSGNGLSAPISAAFDGERMLITNSGDRVSLWKASDLTPLGSVFTGASTNPYGACSDGLNFWITLDVAGTVARF